MASTPHPFHQEPSKPLTGALYRAFFSHRGGGGVTGPVNESKKKNNCRASIAIMLSILLSSLDKLSCKEKKSYRTYTWQARPDQSILSNYHVQHILSLHFVCECRILSISSMFYLLVEATGIDIIDRPDHEGVACSRVQTLIMLEDTVSLCLWTLYNFHLQSQWHML